MQLVKIRSTGEWVLVPDRPQRPAPRVEPAAQEETAATKRRR